MPKWLDKKVSDAVAAIKQHSDNMPTDYQEVIEIADELQEKADNMEEKFPDKASRYSEKADEIRDIGEELQRCIEEFIGKLDELENLDLSLE